MKTLYILIASFALVGCQKSNEDIAKSLINDYIKASANDPESYEPVEFDKLDTLKTFYAYSKEYLENKEKYDDKFRNYEDYNTIRDSLKKAFVPEFTGFMMRHKFRAKNGFGAKILNSKVFYFDKELSKVDSLADTLD